MISAINEKLLKAVQRLWWSGAGITLSDRHDLAHKYQVTLDEVDAAIKHVREGGQS